MTQRVNGPDLPSLPRLTSHTGPFVNNPRGQQLLVDSVNVIKAVLKTEAHSVAKGRDLTERTSQGSGAGAEPQPVWLFSSKPFIDSGPGRRAVCVLPISWEAVQ